jgi:glycine hydroxymethyltransferase
VLDGLTGGGADNTAVEAEVRREARELCRRFPIYPGL